MITEIETPKVLELKVKISKEEFNRARCKLMLGKYLGRFEQTDLYLDHPRSPFARVDEHGALDTREYLRIRTSLQYDTVEYKRVYEEHGEKKVEEYEIAIEDPQAMATLFQKLGYTQRALVKKTRESFCTRGFMVSMDRFVDHGYFIEIGPEDVNSSVESSDMETFLKEHLRISAYQKQFRSYPDLFSK